MTRWKKLVRIAMQQGRLLGDRYMEVHYEDMTSSPIHALTEVCAFLGVPFEMAITQSSQPYLVSSGDQRVGLVKNSGKWKNYFPRSVSDRLENIGGRALVECGYASGQPEGDYTPPPFQQRLWEIRDVSHQYIIEIKKKVAGQSKMPWWAIFSRPLFYFRHRRANRF
jgi:hypothetical protein